MKKFLCFWLIINFFSLSNNVFAWDNKVTHQKISEYSSNLSVLDKSKSDYLKSLGFSGGVTEKFEWNGKTQSISLWIQEGSNLEDSGDRPLNHFHNPLQSSWLNAGLSNIMSGQSALLWAQSYNGSQPTANNWSWQRTRQLYFLALSSNDFNNRSMYFAQTFKGLGHQMHLLQDMAVPAHVRNDAHPLDPAIGTNGHGYYFETWVKVNKPDLTTLHAFVPNPIIPRITFDVPTDMTVNASLLAPITNLYDTNQYDGTNPSTADSIGLSEYTNANFFSDDTISMPGIWTSSDHSFPYPNAANTNLQDYIYSNAVPTTVVAEDGVKDLGFWIQKIGDEFIVHFIKPGYLSTPLYTMIGGGSIYERTFFLDDECHKDYAEKLLPRAVGYSTALLNYFFRGTLGTIRVSGGLKVKNTNAEAMAAFTDPVTGNTIGKISLYYDDTANGRHYLNSLDLLTPLAPGEETTVIPFPEPQNNIQRGRYIIVFQGKLGNEEGAVIGKVDLAPAIYYVATVNGTDKIYKTGSTAPVFDNQNASMKIGKLAPSPDGKNLACATFPGPVIYLLDLTTGSRVPLTNGDWPSWSPDGKKIAFERESGLYAPDSADVEIFTIDPITRVETQLTDIPEGSYSGQPVWSPDGTTIAYARLVPDPEKTDDCLNDLAIYLMNSDGSNSRALTCRGDLPGYEDAAPTWSPDGWEIAFTTKRYVGNLQLHKITISTQTITKLTDSDGTAYNELTPSWSLDGGTIAIGSDKDGDFDIWLIDPNGRGYISNLTNDDSGIDGYPACWK